MSVTTWKLTLEYDGTRYSGWQDQKNARTVMGELRKAAEDYFGPGLEMQGAGRTDAGVHARAQVMHLRVPSRPPRTSEAIRRGLNERLPADIAVLRVDEASPHFHARHDALSRTYIYQIATSKSAFQKKYVWWIKQPLDIGLMARAARLLEGRHDFICFRAADAARPDESTIVVVESAALEVQEDLIRIRLEASHFLWRMVRRVIGVLVKLGLGEITMEDYTQLLEARCGPGLDVAAWTAPAAGLFLESVRYPEQQSPRPKSGPNAGPASALTTNTTGGAATSRPRTAPHRVKPARDRARPPRKR
jgi:tRNA pseudouridine38-40 synthase